MEFLETTLLLDILTLQYFLYMFFVIGLNNLFAFLLFEIKFFEIKFFEIKLSEIAQHEQKHEL